MVGRQTALIATREDEALLLSHLREQSDIALIESFAPTIEGLWPPAFSPEFVGHHTYAIWNRAFPWTPAYGQVGPKAHDPSAIGWYYVANAGAAPVIEFSRTGFHPLRPGRIYWAKTFSAPRGLEYDVEAFSRWYDSLIAWVRGRGKKRTRGTLEPYYLPDAWAQRDALA